MSSIEKDNTLDSLETWLQRRDATEDDIYLEKGRHYAYNRILGTLEPIPDEFEVLLD